MRKVWVCDDDAGTGEWISTDVTDRAHEFLFRDVVFDPGVTLADLICPVDGAISQFGPIQGNQIFQAKGHRNERVVCVFESARGPFVLVLVGATIVGSMATVWHGVVNPPRAGEVREWRYDLPTALRQGEEMGRFLLGSTVVMLFPKGPLAFNPAWAPGRAIRLGEAMAGCS